MSIDLILQGFRSIASEHPGAVARRFKEGRPGRRAIACYPVWAPYEVIHAAGMLPVALLGGGSSVELLHADARFQSFVCSIAKSTLELGFQKKLDGIDGAVFSNICDVARNLGSIFRRNFPDLFVDYLHLPQNSVSSAVVEYAASEIHRLADGLAGAFGARVAPDALTRSIATYNALRARIRRLYAIRVEEPHRIALPDFYAALRASALMPPEEATDRLDALQDELPRRPVKRRDGVRVVVEGAFCEQPPYGLLEVIEESGCQVVEDDLLLGWRWYRDDVPTAGDPFRNLADAYVNRSLPSSTRHEGREHRSAGLIEKVRRGKADAVIFVLPKFCEPALFDYVLMKQGLERAGIPQLVIEFEEKMWTFERTRNEVETFVESMLFD